MNPLSRRDELRESLTFGEAGQEWDSWNWSLRFLRDVQGHNLRPRTVEGDPGRLSSLPECAAGVLPRSAVRLGFVLLVYALCSSTVTAFEPVRANLGKESAWIGEGVPLIITLYSPGPFSGTPSFDLPELARTVIVKAGSPLVGSEEVDGENCLTQRHEFILYTQQAGEFVLPPFRIRFSGKQSFTSNPEPMEGRTPELRFQSKRPPGAARMGVVVSAAAMEIQQKWDPEPGGEIRAGDVILRRITRTAEGTTAMLLPPVPSDPPEGVQVYTAPPEVRDHSERGESRAERTDTVKYQFQRAGSFVLPELTFVWWDPGQGKIKTKTLADRRVEVAEINVVGASREEAAPGSSLRRAVVIGGLLALGCCAWFLRRSVRCWVEVWRAWYQRPEARAVRSLRAACTANDASSAYGALLAWLVARRAEAGWQEVGAILETEEGRELREQRRILAQHLFADASPRTQWHGDRLLHAFCQTRQRANRGIPSRGPEALPALNPGPSRSTL